MRRRIPFLALLIATAIPLLAGCATNALLEDARYDKYQPNQPVNLEVFQRSKDNELLVVYDEQRVKTGSVRRRAYLMRANEDRVRRARRPVFVPLSMASGMDAIPVIRADSTNLNRSVWVYLCANNQGFKLIREGQVEREYPLPMYFDTTKTFFKIALIGPAAVVADAALVGAVAGAIGAAAYYSDKADSDCSRDDHHHHK